TIILVFPLPRVYPPGRLHPFPPRRSSDLPSSYALGRAAILALRDKARAAGWGMRLFHDRLLGAGSLPSKLLAIDLEQLRRQRARDRKSTRLNSSHVAISYAVFCLKKKKKT